MIVVAQLKGGVSPRLAHVKKIDPSLKPGSGLMFCLSCSDDAWHLWCFLSRSVLALSVFHVCISNHSLEQVPPQL